MKSSPASLFTLVFALACGLVGAFLGDRYISRMPNHAGYYLVSVVDASKRVPIPSRPRRTFFIVVDGLRRDAAETMTVTRLLDAKGQCRISDQGSYTVSRPEYALLSTGLEADRTGSRNNDSTAPLTAESIWQIAREEGLRVSGSSHLRWFSQLFPAGFDRFVVSPEHEVNVFTAEGVAKDPLDVNLFHPLYVDEQAHQHGAASREYDAAVKRADQEIAGLFTTIDFDRDLVLLTADHGHRDQGGHGGEQPEIKNVLLCVAGKNVDAASPRGSSERASFDGRNTAPLLAVLLGLRFPRNMRAGEDNLDQIWDVVSRSQLTEAYVADRRASVERFRIANETQLATWLEGGEPRWSRLYAREARAQWIRAGVVVVCAIAFLYLSLRRRSALDGARSGLRGLVWVLLSAFVFWAVHRLVLGELDYTVINVREQFVPRGFATSFVTTFVICVAHVVMMRGDEKRALITDLRILLGVLAILNLGHVLVYGWPLGFPLPPQPMRYFPFIGAIAMAALALVIVFFVITDAIRRRPRRAPRAP